jgi:hypothetical protein
MTLIINNNKKEETRNTKGSRLECISSHIIFPKYMKIHLNRVPYPPDVIKNAICHTLFQLILKESPMLVPTCMLTLKPFTRGIMVGR